MQAANKLVYKRMDVFSTDVFSVRSVLVASTSSFQMALNQTINHMERIVSTFAILWLFPARQDR